MNTDGDNNKSANGRKVLKHFWWLAGLRHFKQYAKCTAKNEHNMVTQRMNTIFCH